MKIEIEQNGKKVNEVELAIPTGNSYEAYRVRKAIIENEVQKLRKVYPFAELWLSFESKMNLQII